jgi:multiple sugar transport system substrate-binding protein
MKKLLTILVGIALLLTGCSGLPGAKPEQTRTPVSVAGATSSVPSQPSVSSNALPVSTQVQSQKPVPTGTATPQGPVTLRLWVPPQFDPAADTPAGRLFQKRLDEFVLRRPDVRIEARVKALDGPGGLYESLATTTGAAQQAMPDLVALPHPLLQTAAVKGLLRPMNGLTNALDDPDWYDYARQLAGLQNSVIGLPFAGDALVQVFRTGEGVQPKIDWNAVLEAKSPLAFSAADLQALFTLALYQAAGGKIIDDQGGLILEVEPLVEVLNFYKAARDLQVMPNWLTQIQNDDQVWEAFQGERADAVETWLSRVHSEGLNNSAISQIPTPDGKPFALASGWAWALTSPDPGRRQLAVQLAEFLTESSYLGRWSEAAGVLPSRPSALAAWQAGDDIARLEPIAASALLYPSTGILDILGPALQKAALKVLKGQLEPLEAAQEAVNRVNPP